MPHTFDVWVSNADSKMVASYLNSIDEKGYKAILSYQKKLREEARIRQYQKETNAWDADMALTPALPKDWDRWVSKVGIPQNYIFYEYRSGGARTGYCPYCEKDVPIKGKPLHNKTGRCPCCRHEITYKAIGKLGWRTDTEEVCIYLIQPRPDGFVVREFWAGKRYLKENLKTPKIYCVEHWRTIYNTGLVRRFYYWGTYNAMDCRQSLIFSDGGQLYLQHSWRQARASLWEDAAPLEPHLKAHWIAGMDLWTSHDRQSGQLF